jgi:PRTRC genetic system protein B
MRFGIDVGGELELKLHQAVLVYRNEQGSRHMATVHSVIQSQSDGPPLLGSGQLLTTAVLRELTWALRTACPIEVLPERVVARTAELLVWWAPAMMRPMFFRAGSELSELSGCRFPYPALLFVVCNGALYVRALRLNQRPGGETALFAAPYWNVGNDGSVCTGTMNFPYQTGANASGIRNQVPSCEQGHRRSIVFRRWFSGTKMRELAPNARIARLCQHPHPPRNDAVPHPGLPRTESCTGALDLER